MSSQLETFLSPAVQTNKTHIARTVQNISIILLIASIVIGVISAFGHNWNTVKVLGILILPLIVAFWLSKYGHASSAVFVLAVSLLIISTILATLGQGIYDVTNFIYPGILIIASLVMNKRAFFILVALILIAVSWLVLGAIFGLFVPQPPGAGALSDLFIVIIVLSATAFSVYLLSNNLQQSLIQANQETMERQQAESALRESQTMLQLIFDHVFDGISVYEEDVKQGIRRLIDCNSRYAEIAGRSKEELLAMGNTLPIQRDVGTQVDRAKFIEHLNHEVYMGHFSWLRPDGQENVVEYAAVQRQVDDRLLVIGVDRDITAQLQVEAALERERTLLRTLVDTMPAVIFAKDVNGRKTLANRGDQLAMGVQSEAEALGKSDADIYPPDRAKRFMEEDRHVLEDGEVYETENMFIDRNTGEQRWVSGSKRPLRNQAGQIIGLIGSFYDITDIKQAEFERERLIAELEAKNAELERFTYTVSHDLKSPLITIGGFVGFLQKDLQNNNVGQAQNDIVHITTALTKMEQLLNDLLELSRIGRRMNPPETVPFEVIAHEAVELVQGRITAGDVVVEIMPGLPTVHGDRARLVEVVQNLVDNACKYMGDTPDPHIEIGARQTETEMVFYVRDNGIGIDPRHHDQVFELFDKLDPASEGTGVGLAIVKRIVETHGGRIWIDSEGNGHGSTFCFTLAAAM
jgi:PAS domain S-box-containing protein